MADNTPTSQITSIKEKFEETKPVRSGTSATAYATRKTVAQGMLDFALLMANASQMKALVKSKSVSHDAMFVVLLFLIAVSIILQIITGIIIAVLGAMDVHDEAAHLRAHRLNNTTVGLILGITVINVFVAAFGMDL
ncbi:ninjurin-1-like [Haliotis rufescens]|uniref:ninjurin-1-like n=1 Tax=Haliotis rufescens TaxID=6454 RepID=UPI00201EA4C3|nr:ninjurin-1-like [Haliotis rufescens]